MPTTKYKIAEQVLIAVSGGITDTANNVQIEDIIEAVGQMVNQKLKAEYFNDLALGGDTTPNTYILATFEKVPVVQYGCDRSYAELPATPVKLPRNMGVWAVSNKEDFSVPFIPMQSGQYALIQKQPILSKLMGQVAYEVVGNKIVFSDDISDSGQGVVYIQEILFDINSLDDYAPLQIPPDWEFEIVTTLIKQFGVLPNGDNYSDNNTQIVNKQ